jgi:hypothetical protein
MKKFLEITLILLFLTGTAFSQSKKHSWAFAWDVDRYIAFINENEIITGKWTFQDSTFFNGVLTANIVVIDTLFVNYIDADTILVENFIRPKTDQCADNGQASYRWNYIYGDTTNTNVIIANTEVLPDLNLGANLGGSSLYWNIGYVDSLLSNYSSVSGNLDITGHYSMEAGDTLLLEGKSGNTYILCRAGGDTMGFYVGNSLYQSLRNSEIRFFVPTVYDTGASQSAVNRVLDMSMYNDGSGSKYWYFFSTNCYARRDGLIASPAFYASQSYLTADDIAYNLGAGSTVQTNVGKMLWETADANANCVFLTMPEGGGTDVPVWVFGDSTILNKDLGWFNGVTEPLGVWVDDDADSWVGITFLSDDTPGIKYGGASNSFGINGDLTVSDETNLGDAITDTVVLAGLLQLPDEGKIFFNTDLDNYLYTPGNDTIDWFIDGRNLLRMTPRKWTFAPDGGADTSFKLLLPGCYTAANPTIGFRDGDCGIHESSDDVISFSINGSDRWEITIYAFGGNAYGEPALYDVCATSTTPGFIFRDDSNTGIGRAEADSLSLIAGGVEIMRLPEGGRNYPQAMAGGIDLIEQSSLPATFIAGTVMVANDSMFISFDGSTWLNIVTQARKP